MASTESFTGCAGLTSVICHSLLAEPRYLSSFHCGAPPEGVLDHIKHYALLPYFLPGARRRGSLPTQLSANH